MWNKGCSVEEERKVHMLEGGHQEEQGGSPERGEFGGPREHVLEPAVGTVKTLVLLD